MQAAKDLIGSILISKFNSEDSKVSLKDISKYYSIFENFSYTEKLCFIRYLSNNIGISYEFYSLFISTIYDDKIYENDKSFLKYIDSEIILNTKVYFPDFYFQFINFLYFSDYNFDTFENDFKNNKNTSTIDFVKETIQHVSLIKNIESF